MKLQKVPCARCKKSFDFELYAGLCPNCGLAHQAPGDAHFEKLIVEKTEAQKNQQAVVVHKTQADKKRIEQVSKKHDRDSAAAEYKRHEDLDRLLGRDHYDHHDTKEDPHIAQMKQAVETQKKDWNSQIRPEIMKEQKKANKSKSAYSSFVVIMVLVIIFSVLVICYVEPFQEYLSDHISGTDVNIVQGSVNEVIESGDYSYCVYDAYILSDPVRAYEYDGTELPEGTKLVAVGMAIEYTGEQVDDLDDRYLPYVYDGDRYTEPASYSKYSGIARQYGIDDHTVDGYNVYTYEGAHEGYVYYLVDEDADMITVCLEGRSGGYLKEIYEVTVSLQDSRE